MLYEKPEMLITLIGDKNVVTDSTLIENEWEQPEDGFEFE